MPPVYPPQGPTEASISEPPKGTAKNLQARPLPLAKGPGKGWPKSRKSFWQYLPYSSQTSKKNHTTPSPQFQPAREELIFHSTAQPLPCRSRYCAPISPWLSGAETFSSLLYLAEAGGSTLPLSPDGIGGLSGQLVFHPPPSRTLVLPPDWYHWIYH